MKGNDKLHKSHYKLKQMQVSEEDIQIGYDKISLMLLSQNRSLQSCSPYNSYRLHKAWSFLKDNEFMLHHQRSKLSILHKNPTLRCKQPYDAAIESEREREREREKRIRRGVNSHMMLL